MEMTFLCVFFFPSWIKIKQMDLFVQVVRGVLM